MIYYLLPLLLLVPLFAEFRMEDHVVPKSAPNTYPSEQPNYYGNGPYGTPYMQNTPYGSYYAVPTYEYSERFFDNPNWPNVSHEDVTIKNTGTSYYGPNYGYSNYGNGNYGQTTTIYRDPYVNQPGSTTYYLNR